MNSHKNIKRLEIQKLLKEGFKQKKSLYDRRRNENYQNLVTEWSKKETFDFSKLGNVQKQKLNESKNSKYVLRDRYMEDIEYELQQIIEELENDSE